MPPPWPAGVDRLILDEVDSTNTYAADLGRRGAPPTWVMAKRQTASRGRRGRAWSFQEGNLATTFLVWPDKPVAEIAQMSFVAALALFDAVVAVAPDQKPMLKWPNDLLLDGQKLSGILLETVEYGSKLGLVIGIGVNLIHVPGAEDLEDRALPAASLEAMTGTKISPECFLDRLAPSMSRWQSVWETHGFLKIREAWLARAQGLGSRIVARLPKAEHHGVFEDIDTDGSLVLRTSSTRLVLPAADIYFAPGTRG